VPNSVYARILIVTGEFQITTPCWTTASSHAIAPQV